MCRIEVKAMPQPTRQEPQTGIGREQPPCSRVDPAAVAQLLEEFMQGDELEQRDTFEFLRQALDRDRPAGYKLFS